MMKAKNLRTLIAAAVAQQAYKVQASDGSALFEDIMRRCLAGTAAYKFCKGMPKIATTDLVHDKKFGLMNGLKFAPGSNEYNLAMEAAHALQAALVNIRPAFFDNHGNWLPAVSFGFAPPPGAAPLKMHDCITSRKDSEAMVIKRMLLSLITILRQEVHVNYAMGAGIVHHLGIPEHNTPYEGYAGAAVVSFNLGGTLHDYCEGRDLDRWITRDQPWMGSLRELTNHVGDESLTARNMYVGFATAASHLRPFFTVDNGVPVSHITAGGSAHPIPKMKMAMGSINDKVMGWLYSTFHKEFTGALQAAIHEQNAGKVDGYSTTIPEIRALANKAINYWTNKSKQLPRGYYVRFSIGDIKYDEPPYFNMALNMEVVSNVDYKTNPNAVLSKPNEFHTIVDADEEMLDSIDLGVQDAMTELYSKFLSSPLYKHILALAAVEEGQKAPVKVAPPAPPKVAPPAVKPAVKPPVKVAPPAMNHGKPMPEINISNPDYMHPVGAKYLAYLQGLADQAVKDASIIHKLPEGTSLTCKIENAWTKDNASTLYFDGFVRIFDAQTGKGLWGETVKAYDMDVGDERAFKGQVFNLSLKELNTFVRTDVAKTYLNKGGAAGKGALSSVELNQLNVWLSNWHKADPHGDRVPRTWFKDSITMYTERAVRDAKGQTKITIKVGISNYDSDKVVYRWEGDFLVKGETEATVTEVGCRAAIAAMTAYNHKHDSEMRKMGGPMIWRP